MNFFFINFKNVLLPPKKMGHKTELGLQFAETGRIVLIHSSHFFFSGDL